MNFKKKESVQKKTKKNAETQHSKNFEQPSLTSRRHRPLVHGGTQRLHASPTVSDSRAGEGGERNLSI